MNVGDIYWVEILATNGHEQADRRPALVLQQAALGRQLPTVLIVPLTGARAALRFPGTVEIKATPENGLRTDSVALLFQFRSIDRRRLQERIGLVSPETLARNFAELDRLMGRS